MCVCACVCFIVFYVCFFFKFITWLQLMRNKLYILCFVVVYRSRGMNRQLELLVERTAASEVSQKMDAAKPES